MRSTNIVNILKARDKRQNEMKCSGVTLFTRLKNTDIKMQTLFFMYLDFHTNSYQFKWAWTNGFEIYGIVIFNQRQLKTSIKKVPTFYE